MGGTWWDWAVGPGEGRGVVHCRWLADLGRPGGRAGMDQAGIKWPSLQSGDPGPLLLVQYEYVVPYKQEV